MARRFHIVGGRAHIPRPLKDLPLRRLIPSLVTILAICIGFTSIRFALEGRFEAAALALLAAGFLDMADGRIARFFKETTRFGAELDSLADFLNFGIAAALLLYHWGLAPLGGLGWMIALFYVACCALRLARFNTQIEDNDYATRHGYFIGVPAPAAAGLTCVPLYLHFLGLLPTPAESYFALLLCAFAVLASAALMISRLPTFSHKMLSGKIRRHLVLPLFLCVAIAAAFLINFPWTVLAACGVLYIALLPVSASLFYRGQRKEREAQEDGDAFPPEEDPHLHSSL